MKVTLYHRHFGIHTKIKECEIEGTFRRYGKSIDNDFEINEDRLIKALPKKFLPCESNKVLITVEEGCVGTGVSNLKMFRPWSKYFNSYSIGLLKRK